MIERNRPRGKSLTSALGPALLVAGALLPALPASAAVVEDVARPTAMAMAPAPMPLFTATPSLSSVFPAAGPVALAPALAAASADVAAVPAASPAGPANAAARSGASVGTPAAVRAAAAVDAVNAPHGTAETGAAALDALYDDARAPVPATPLETPESQRSSDMGKAAPLGRANAAPGSRGEERARTLIDRDPAPADSTAAPMRSRFAPSEQVIVVLFAVGLLSVVGLIDAVASLGIF